MRLSCRIERASRHADHDDTTPLNAPPTPTAADAPAEWLALNEVVIDRGTSTYLGSLDIYCDGRLMTTAQARAALSLSLSCTSTLRTSLSPARPLEAIL